MRPKSSRVGSGSPHHLMSRLVVSRLTAQGLGGRLDALRKFSVVKMLYVYDE